MNIKPARSVALLCLLALTIAAPQTAAGQGPASESTTLAIKEVSEPQGWHILHGDRLIVGYIVESAGRPVICTR